jgi:hypothetical protein
MASWSWTQTAFLDKHEFDFVDNWRTPHTKDMHVVERFRLIDGGKGLEATVSVDDLVQRTWFAPVQEMVR